jgi:hypothetical protein
MCDGLRYSTFHSAMDTSHSAGNYFQLAHVATLVAFQGYEFELPIKATCSPAALSIHSLLRVSPHPRQE